MILTTQRIALDEETGNELHITPCAVNFINYKVHVIIPLFYKGF